MRRPSVLGSKCLSGPSDNAFTDLRPWQDVWRPVYSKQQIVAAATRLATRQISDKTVHNSEAYKLIKCKCKYIFIQYKLPILFHAVHQ